MKRNRWSLILLLLSIFTLILLSSNSNAAIPQGWYVANIVFVGPFFDKIIMMVDATDGSFTGQYFVLNPSMQNQLYASALTAVSIQKSVSVYVADDPHFISGTPVQTCLSLIIWQ